MEMLPTGALDLLDSRIDAKINKAFEEFKPELREAVRGVMEQSIRDAQAAGIVPPGTVNPGAGVPEGGAIPGSPVTPTGAALLNWITKSGSGGEEGLDSFIKQASRYKAIGELFNPPPSIIEKVMQTAYIRNLKNIGIVTDKEMKTVEKTLLGDLS